MRCDSASIGAVRGFCDSVSATSASNLKLLSDIERTVDWLSGFRKQIEGEASFAEKFREAVVCAPVKTIDSDDSIRDKIVDSEDKLKKLVAMLGQKKQAALRDPSLRGDNEAAVVSEYDQTIETVKTLHDAMAELRWAIMEHDADLEKAASKPFSTAEDAIKDLKA
jgi:hypothetical protein